MSRKAPTYSPDQRSAIAHAFNARDWTATDVLAAAAAGELETPDGRPVPAFNATRSAIYDVARRARNASAGNAARLAVAGDTRGALAELYARTVSVLDRSIGRLEQQASPDVDALTAAANTLAKLAALERALPAATPPPDTERPPTIIETLEQAHRTSPRPPD